MSETLLTRAECASYLRLKSQTLAAWACRHQNALPYVKIGRLIRYRLEDVQAFLRAQTVNTPANTAAD